MLEAKYKYIYQHILKWYTIWHDGTCSLVMKRQYQPW